MTAPPTPPAIELPRGSIACLALAAFGSGLSLRVNDALLPRLAGEFAVSLDDASQVISLFAIAYGVSQLFFGPMGDRFGKYRVIAWAVQQYCLVGYVQRGIAQCTPLQRCPTADPSSTTPATPSVRCCTER